MALLLNIDTASANATVSITRDGKLLHVTENPVQKEHAAFLQPAIQSLLKKSNYTITDVDGIAVVEGPGSYTGLRVGMAAAKGLCYVLQKPLITIGTLPMMALAMVEQQERQEGNTLLFCPMIDARRMEVYSAVFDRDLKVLLSPCAIILEPGSFDEYLKKARVIFFGNGAAKWKRIVNDPHAQFNYEYDHLHAFNKIAFEKFILGDFADTAYSEPLYVKDFQQG